MANVTLHDVTFVTAPNNGAYQNWANRDTTNWELLDTSGNTDDTPKFTYGNALTFGGLYIAKNSGLKINNGSADVSVKYLYLDSAIEFATTTNGAIDSINWSGNEANASLNIQDKGWVDINSDYAARISLASMTTGAVYLNTAGALTLTSDGSAYTLSNNVVVYATITDSANKRTLLSGNFSAWEGNVVLQNADGTAYTAGAYTWETSAEGLNIVTVTVPEPTTATLSLLALAGLAARRRRK